MRHHIVLYGIGLDAHSLFLCSRKLREQVRDHQLFSGEVFTCTSGFSSPVTDIFEDICEIYGPKVVVLLYRHDGVTSLGGLRSFVLALTQLCSSLDDTKLAVCFPIPNQATLDHIERSRDQAYLLVDLEHDTLGELQVIELHSALRQRPDFLLQIPGVTRFNPHSITPNGCSRIAASMFQQLVDIVQR